MRRDPRRSLSIDGAPRAGMLRNIRGARLHARGADRDGRRSRARRDPSGTLKIEMRNYRPVFLLLVEMGVMATALKLELA